jgi:hypothetical protein
MTRARMRTSGLADGDDQGVVVVEDLAVNLVVDLPGSATSAAG